MAPDALTGTDALARLRALDARFDAEGVVRRTLDPTRERATALDALATRLAPRAPSPRAAVAVAEGLGALAEAILTHFPDNLLWDLDALAAALLREAAAAPEPAAEVREAFDDAVALHALFGHATTIRFRYVHDFVYGFDWAKWVRRDPARRRHVGPYDRAFLRTMHRRGRELLALIEADDAKYPQLRGAGARNPFGFSREPEAELRLHRDLAARDLVPVRAWELEPTPVWDRPFADEREARARALDLTPEGRAPWTT